MKLRPRIRIFHFLISGIVLILLTTCKKDDKSVPILITDSVSNISDTSATSGGNITNDGGETVLTRGVCWSTDINPTIIDNLTKDGAGAGRYISNFTGLVGGTTYYLRAYATNSEGTGYGMTMSFITNGQPPSAPIVTTQNASSIQTTSATLNASINAKYLSTIVTFEYGTTASYGSTITVTQSPLTGGGNTSVSINIANLIAGSNYHFRAKATNSLGTTIGSDMTFKTLGNAPTVTTLAPTNLTIAEAQLNGSVNANYLETIVIFEYGTTASYGSTIEAIQSPVTGGGNTPVSANISNLLTNTTYHFRVKATNSLGTTYGSDLTFKAFGNVPTVTTLAANSTPITAELNGSVNANYLETTVIFEYGTTASYGSTIIAIESPVTGGTDTPVSANILFLVTNTTYHFRVKATNSLGTTYGSDLTFKTVYEIGGNLDGGIIFYIDGTSQHGLVCAPDNQSSGVLWCNSEMNIPGADGTAVGTGNQNTIDIVNGCSADGIAAKICYDLVLSNHKDWYLPSKDELNLMYTNLKLKGLGNFADNFYWSSSESNYGGVWAQNFGRGAQSKESQTTKLYVRAIRTF
jgi:hypothetical protein